MLFRLLNNKMQKGDCYFYRSQGTVYGAVVLEIQAGPMGNNTYFLIAITEKLSTANHETILSTPIYTAAWFSEKDLPFKKFYRTGCVDIQASFSNFYGLTVVQQKSITCSNVGQTATWKHKFRAMNFHGMTVPDLIDRQKSHFKHKSYMTQ